MTKKPCPKCGKPIVGLATHVYSAHLKDLLDEIETLKKEKAEAIYAMGEWRALAKQQPRPMRG